MGYCEFSPWGNKSVTIEFECDNCGQKVTSGEIRIPAPNYLADKASDSHNENDGDAVCEECEKNFNVYVYAGYADGYVEVNDVDDETIVVNEIADERELDYYIEEQIDAIIGSSNYINIFIKDISNLKQLNDVDLGNTELQETLRRQIYSGAITCLEDYLSTTIIQGVLNNEEFFKNFVKTYHGIKNRRFNLSEIYEKFDKLRDIVKIELVEIIYHDLPKVKRMYQDTFQIEFPALGDLMDSIKKRHDMVHRNGKNKEGEKIELTRELTSDVIDKVEKFVQDIDSKLTNR
jgi:hypothetical protein